GRREADRAGILGECRGGVTTPAGTVEVKHRGVVDRGHGDVSGGDVGQVVGQGAVVDLEAGGARGVGGVVAGVVVGHRTKRVAVVGQGVRARQGQHTGGGVP